MNNQAAGSAARRRLVRMVGLVGQVSLVGLAVSGPAQSAEAVAGRFVANGAEVTDTLTGLVWRRCSEGQSWTGSNCAGSAASFTWSEALDRARAEASGGVPWRLPNAKELSSLVDDSRADPAIDTSLFPGTPSYQFWTSTHLAGNTSYGWVVYFYYGNVYTYYSVNPSAVRLVRAGQ